ncbi:MAG: sulfite exporter TauE/SafE family protein [Desulfobacterales bacterium]|nr:sulfite exporter TauE/SafE family protein [Desulfobacterales bacterium]MDJ0854649.1 sulfite exporter TauE/SafE family protein [Desulfobacterales bacterium]MDJ0988394.1 sulfite exporter TauE/SafE family protein [Desulfobacterales bacterium]
MSGVDELSLFKIVILGAILLLSGGVQGLLGFGFPLLATPLMAMLLDVRTAMLLLLIPTMGINIASIAQGGRGWLSIGRFWPLVVCVAAGSVAGTRLLIVTDPAPYKLLLAVVLCFYLAFQQRGLRMPWVRNRPRTAMIAFGLAAGLLAGTVNAAVPALIVYALELGLAPLATVRVFNLCFLSGKLSQAMTFGAAGLFTAEVIWRTLPAGLLALTGLWVGTRIRGRVDTDTYRRWLRRTLFVIAILLAVQYAMGAWRS